MTLRPNALPTNVPRWDAQSPRVARTAPLTSRYRTRGQNMELHKQYSTSASTTHGTVAPKKRKIWSFFITSSSEPQNLKKTHESRLLGYFREILQVNISSKERQTETGYLLWHSYFGSFRAKIHPTTPTSEISSTWHAHQNSRMTNELGESILWPTPQDHFGMLRRKPRIKIGLIMIWAQCDHRKGLIKPTRQFVPTFRF